MRICKILTLLAFTGGVAAQTSPGAPYSVGNYLPVSFNNSITVQPGLLFQPSQLPVGPTFGIARTNSSTNQPFVVILIDLNVVLNVSNPSNQSEFLHVLQPNLYALNSTNGNLTFLTNGPNSTSVVGAPYFPGTPPPGSIHNYNVFLFNQPANFTIPPAFARFNRPANELARINFNITVFARESGLGLPVAANYYRALDGTAAQSSVVQSQTATSGVAFSSGYSFATSSGGTIMTGSSGSATRSTTSSAATGTSSTSFASTSKRLDQNNVGLIYIAVLAALVLLG